MKKLLSLILALFLLFSLVPTALAADAAALSAADELHALGLFDGVGTDAAGRPIYDLDRAPTRAEAITMLVRLLGKETQAKSGKWTIPFTDVDDWAKPYVGYAYASGLTAGISASEFGSTAPVSAAQYITFVLRALGYSDKSGDFRWDAAWELSDALGLTHGEYGKASGAFLRGDLAIVSCGALKRKVKNSSETLLDTIFTGSVDFSGKIPEETGARQLSDGQLEALRGMSPEQAAGSVRTLADAYAWLAQEGYSTHGMAGSPANGLTNGTSGKKISWVEMSAVLNTLLAGDYAEVGTLLLAAQSDVAGWDMLYISFNYVQTGGIYYVTDPVDLLESSGLPVFRAHTIRAGSLSAVKKLLGEANANIDSLVTLAAYPLFTDHITVDWQKAPLSFSFPNIPDIQYIYRADQAALDAYEREKEQAAAAEAAAWDRAARNYKVSDYGMPAAIGTTTLDYDAARELVGKDPQEIARQVKTVGDVLQYMIAARFGYNSPSAYTPWYGSGSETWGFDAPGDEQLRQNYGCCCGGYANTVSYLLQGDYEKVGTLRWVGGGNHTISWVYTGGKYYVFDFTQYCSGGNYNNVRSVVTVLDRLEDFYDRMPDTYSFFPKSEVVIMVAFEAGEAMYPSRWSDPPYFTGLTFPKEAEGKVTLIYQKDPAYGVRYQTVGVSIPGWNS